MPITGLTDRKTTKTDLRLRAIGTVRKGEKKGSDLVDLEYFRFVPSPGFEGVTQAFHNIYGNEPRMLYGYLPYATVEQNWSTWKESWGKRIGLMHRCDGNYMVQWLDDATKKYVRDYDLKLKRPCPFGPFAEKKGWGTPCKQVGRLSLILPELMKELVFNGAEYGLEAAPLGFVTVVTTSEHDLGNLSRELFTLEEQGGRDGLRQMPVILRRVLEEVGVRFEGNDGKPVKTKQKKWMLHISTTNDYVIQQLAATEVRRQIAAKSGSMPPATATTTALVPVADADVIEGEYYEAPVAAEIPWNGGNGDEAPKPATKKKPKPAAKKKAKSKPDPGNGRPYSPTALRDKIAQSVEQRRNERFKFATGKLPKFQGATRANLEACFAGDAHSDDKRHAVAKYLVGEASSSKWDDAQTKALHRWLDAKPDDGGLWTPDAMAVKEAQSVAREAMKEAGQAELPL